MIRAGRNEGGRGRNEAEMPPYVVVGEWTDETGRNRSNPYGLGAFATIVDGVAHVFPSGEAWRRHMAARTAQRHA